VSVSAYSPSAADGPLQPFGKVVIVGVGLIGGSFALGLKSRRLAGHVVGVGRSTANLQRAVELGVIDSIGSDPATTYADADLVFLATPVGQMAASMAAMAAHLPSSAILTDGGSTKQDVVAYARQHLGAHLPHFVPAHPIAGAEASGVEAARADLYPGKKCILTPMAQTDAGALARVASAWDALGMGVFTMSPGEHDQIFAAVSHFPHLMAYALVDDIARRPQAAQLFQFAGAGFRDSTRIAGAHPEMWRDILLANQEAILNEIDRYQDNLARLRDALAAGDGDTLIHAFTQARDARAAWLARTESEA
jgi:prephenate dehydrogenase